MVGYGSMEEPSLLLERRQTGRQREPRWTAPACCGANGLFSRVTALLLMSLVGFGAFFCFDNPGALQTEMKDVLSITTSQFASLYACYSWPNVFLPVIGGFLIDRVFGVRLGTVIFAMFILAGQILLSIGGFLNWLWFMDLARFIFGIGGESLNMALNTYTVSWFKGKELNMVFGFQLSIARVGSTVNFLVMGPLFHHFKTNYEEHFALGWILLIACSFTVMSFICSLLLGWLDLRRERVMLSSVNLCGETESVKFSDIKNFPATFWFLCICTMAYYGSIFPFVSLAQGFFNEKFDFDEQEANFIIGLVYLVSAIASPFFGFLIDKTGKNLSWVLMAVAVSAISHCLLAFTYVNPYLSVILLGVAYSILASALWSLPVLLVPDHQLGTAFGIMQALQNLGTALITMGAGTIVDKYGYFWLEVFFIAWLKVSLISAICIWTVDYNSTNSFLNLSANKREENEKIDNIDMENLINNNK
eukprot:GFUD01024256.1.p1 GENE.GFUD01024256.1~~GFUD01024256.1.p1  ORF type:complete len:476 (-),score=103.76 GFUD01024256.1:150-1577(-)